MYQCKAFDSLDKRYKNPQCAVKSHEKASLIIRIPDCYQSAFAEIKRIDCDGILSSEMEFIGYEGAHKVFKSELFFDEPCVVFYNFRLVREDGSFEYLNRGALQQADFCKASGNCWQLTVYDKNYTQPSGFAGKTMYQIFPDRFCRGDYHPSTDRIIRDDWGGMPFYSDDKNHPECFIGNDFFGGNLAGISDKLDYLKELGVKLIYLNPIFMSESNHRYNTSDYFKIDPILGDEKAFSELCRKIHKKGMKVILDGVFSHVGSDSIYFDISGKYKNIGAYHNPDSKYRSWFTFDDSEIGYKCWWGVFSLPEINETEPSYMDFICGENGVIEHWMKLGADGFRLDVADELPDAFIDCVRARIKSLDRDALLIGEVWEDASTKYSHGGRRRYLLGNQLDGVMNYPFKNAVINFMLSKNAKAFLEEVTQIYNNYPFPILNCTMNFLSTHDTIRAISLLSGSEACGLPRLQQAERSLSKDEYQRGKKLFKTAMTVLFLLNGIPSIYYGDEAGLCGFADPFNRLCYPWGNEDKELLSFVRSLCTFRNEHESVLADGRFEIAFSDESTAVFKRIGTDNTLICAVNMSDAPTSAGLEMFKKTLFGRLDKNGMIPPESAVVGMM